jgi:(1->4)-alpha-D-glucan 1-alpha-D-glucosylmutase
MLAELAGPPQPQRARALTAAKEDGRIKLYLTSRALRCRAEQAELFTAGEYLPLDVEGARKDHVFAFARRHEQRWAVVAVPRLLTRLLAGPSALPLGRAVWHDTTLVLPKEAPPRLRHVFTGETLEAAEREGKRCLDLADGFAHFPVALLLA